MALYTPCEDNFDGGASSYRVPNVPTTQLFMPKEENFDPGSSGTMSLHDGNIVTTVGTPSSAGNFFCVACSFVEFFANAVLYIGALLSENSTSEPDLDSASSGSDGQPASESIIML